MSSDNFDAILRLSFGGPEKMADVRPFLENVTRGRGIPPERLDEVGAHYAHFGGKSPLNDLNRARAWETAATFRGGPPAERTSRQKFSLTR